MEDLNKAIKTLSKKLDLMGLPEEVGEAICLANDLDVLRMAQAILKFYRDELN